MNPGETAGTPTQRSRRLGTPRPCDERQQADDRDRAADGGEGEPQRGQPAGEQAEHEGCQRPAEQQPLLVAVDRRAWGGQAFGQAVP
jgi:hypothetical protein